MKSAKRRNMAAPQRGVTTLALASALGATASAHAQTYNWTGVYVGGNLGGAQGQVNTNTYVTTCPPITGGTLNGYFCTLPSIPTSQANATSISGSGSGSASPVGFVGGGQAGFNWQWGNLVLGGEADADAFNLHTSRSVTAPYLSNGGAVTAGQFYTINTSFDSNWLFTFRGRLGWTVANWLFYGTGGVAMADIAVGHSFSDINPSGGFSGAFESATASGIQHGPVVGGGVEFAVTQHLTLKAEYLHVNLGTIATGGTVLHNGHAGYSNGLGTSWDVSAHIARAGFNFKF